MSILISLFAQAQAYHRANDSEQKTQEYGFTPESAGNS
jgi:hypothetical protein